MTHPEVRADPAPRAGRAGSGSLSRVLSTRGTATSPERPIVIEHREALIYMLSEAAEVEHLILCQYLFAAFSMKASEEEGLTADQVHDLASWKKTLLEVAGQEMLHLALVQNLLTAIGASPHLTRPNLPCPARHFPSGVRIALVPFGERALRHFLYLERPEGIELDDADGFEAAARAVPLMEEGDIVPRLQDFATVGHLYRSIEEGFAHLTEKLGENRLFVGPPAAQATGKFFRWPDLVAVTDLASARQALESIVEQGEGASGEWRDAHFGRFNRMLLEFQARIESEPTFEPARPVLAANVRPPESGAEVPLIESPTTAKVVDLGNVAYEMLLQVLYRFFAHTEETEAELMTLADVAVLIMFQLIEPLGELATRLPVSPDRPDVTAGPSFELFYETDYFFPHREAAWILLEERMRETAAFARRIASEAPELEPELEKAAGAATALADRLAAGIPPQTPS